MNGPSGRPHVVALCGSLRAESRTRVALTEVVDAAREAGATADLLDLREYDLPGLDPDAEPVGDAETLCREVAAADSIALGTPNYHGSVSGVLKNALDYCGRDEFAGTTVGLLEVAGGQHPGRPLSHLRTIGRTLNAWVLPTEVAIGESHAAVTGDGIADAAVAERTRRLGTDLVAYAGVTDYPETVDCGDEAAADD